MVLKREYLPLNEGENKEIGLTPYQLLQFNLIKRRESVLTALDEYYSKDVRGSGYGQEHKAIGFIRTYFLQCRTMLINSEDVDIQLIEKLVMTDSIEEAIKGFNIMEDMLYKKKITKLDSIKNVNQYDIEAVNEAHGL